MVTNISSESIIAQKHERDEAIKKSQEKKVRFGSFEFDEKHYLNTRLGKNEDKKEIVIRLLPFSLTETSPFKRIYVHSVRVINENGDKVWKKFMCPIKMEKHDKCPFCEIAAEARKRMFDELDEAKKKDFSNVEYMNRAKDYWLIRCIERGHEEDGVKFWRFPDTRNGDGIYDKMSSLFETKYRRGVELFDLYRGKDLVITITKQKDRSGKEKLVYQVQDDEEIKPLADNDEQMEEWVNSPIRWEDVYSVKDYEYLSLAAEEHYPVWDKEANKWVAKVFGDNADTNNTSDTAQDSDEDDFSKFTVDIRDDEKTSNLSETTEDDEDDLPF